MEAFSVAILTVEVWVFSVTWLVASDGGRHVTSGHNATIIGVVDVRVAVLVAAEATGRKGKRIIVRSFLKAMSVNPQQN